jgi:Tfp pilus assembly protein PilF
MGMVQPLDLADNRRITTHARRWGRALRAAQKYAPQGHYAVAEKELHHTLTQSLPIHNRIVISEFLAICLQRQGKMPEAEHVYQQALEDSQNAESTLDEVFVQIHLASIDLAQIRLDSAAERLSICREALYAYRDAESQALMQQTYAHLHILRNDIPAAHIALTEAIDLFERLGMRRELVESREELRRLEMSEMPAA